MENIEKIEELRSLLKVKIDCINLTDEELDALLSRAREIMKNHVENG